VEGFLKLFGCDLVRWREEVGVLYAIAKLNHMSHMLVKQAEAHVCSQDCDHFYFHKLLSDISTSS
jgi:hypothetical protein